MQMISTVVVVRWCLNVHHSLHCMPSAAAVASSHCSSHWPEIDCEWDVLQAAALVIGANGQVSPQNEGAVAGLPGQTVASQPQCRLGRNVCRVATIMSFRNVKRAICARVCFPWELRVWNQDTSQKKIVLCLLRMEY